jgi:hypothetical protein
MKLTIAILIKEGEGLLEFSNLLFGELVSHVCSSRVDFVVGGMEMGWIFFGCLSSPCPPSTHPSFSFFFVSLLSSLVIGFVCLAGVEVRSVTIVWLAYGRKWSNVCPTVPSTCFLLAAV